MLRLSDPATPLCLICLLCACVCVYAVTSVGFGDITASSTREKVETCMIEILGGFVWAIVIAVFSDMLYGMGESTRQYNGRLRQISATLDYLNAPTELQNAVHQHFEYRFHKHTLFAEDNLTGELPPRLRRELLELRFRAAIGKVPFFRESGSATLVALCTSMQTFCANNNEVICEVGETCRDIFIVEKGVAEASIGNKVVEQHGAGAFFGELMFFGLTDGHRLDTVTAQKFCELVWITCECMHVVEHSPRTLPPRRVRLSTYRSSQEFSRGAACAFQMARLSKCLTTIPLCDSACITSRACGWSCTKWWPLELTTLPQKLILRTLS